MKPVSLKLKNFGPFTEEQFIDFSELEKSGLFLIYGNTGSGKTTILDAICCALYCSSSNGERFGGKGRAALEKMRCQQAKDSEPTYVELIFDSNGKRYRFYREIRLNKGGVNFNEEHFCGIYNGTEYVPLDSNLKMERVNALAEEIIGLTPGQFRQVVILPQGRFEQLLTSDSGDKEAILSGIFDVYRWDRVVEKIRNRVNSGRKALDLEYAAIQTSLGQYGCSSVDELGALAKEKSGELEIKKKAEKALRKETAELEKKKSALEREDEQFKNLDEKEKLLAALGEKMKNSAAQEKTLSLAEAAAKIKPVYEKKTAASEKKAEAVINKAKAEKNAEDARGTLETVKKQLDAHTAKKAENDEKIRLATTYESAVETYKALDGKKKALDDAKAAFALCEKKHGAAKKAHEEATAELDSAKAEFEQADDELRLLRKAYDENIGSVLAKKLEPGMPCPVCGSTSHPHPASHTGREVGKEEVEKAEAARNEANEKYSAAQDLAGNLLEKLNSAADEMHLADTARARAEADYGNALGGTVSGIATLAQLEKETARIRNEIRAFETETDNLNKKHTEAVGSRDSAEALLKEAEKALAAAAEEAEKAAGVWAPALAESEFADEKEFICAQMEPDEIKERRQALTTLRANYETALKETAEMKKKLEGREKPDLRAFNEAMQAKKKEFEGASRDAALLADTVEKMNTSLVSLSKKTEEYSANSLRNDREKQFFEMVDGRNGVGIKRYVLGIMLDLVTNRANEMLGSIYGGRYRIRRSGKKAGRERNVGLAFEIEDRYCGKCRNSSDISGGEKFLVSLSLAIGLSDVVRAQGSGINLEAIFIDEGFGTLDKECLGDALFVLQNVKEKNGMVGVISHVDELAENITARIETTKTENGSRCDVFFE